MQLTFLGTSASEGYPNAFCDCDNCQLARQLGGPNLRKRSSVLIDELLLIDLGPDLMASAQQHDISLAAIQYCLQTHEHQDHLDPNHFFSRSEGCGVFDVPRLHWYATIGAIERASQHFGDFLPSDGLLDADVEKKLNIKAHPTKCFAQFSVGPYRVTSLKANHAPELEALLYVIEKGDSTLFYATDTGIISEETWQVLCEHKFHLNVVIMDHTFGLTERGGGHLNSKQFVAQIERLKAEALLAADARIYATHIGHHSNPDHQALVDYASGYGYEPAYDGLIIDIMSDAKRIIPNWTL